MKSPLSLFPPAILAAMLFLSPSMLAAAGGGDGGEIPDFTKGDSIPDGATHDWNLGPTGARGWMYSHRLETTEARQIRVTAVAPGSPAAGVLEVGDVLLGVAGEPFRFDPRTELGRAISEAEASDGALSVICWRAGERNEVTLTLPILGRYSPTAPFDCAKSQRIFEQGCEALAAAMKAEPDAGNPIIRSYNALALLASGREAYLPLVRYQVQWASQYTDPERRSYHSWFYGPVTILVAEYILATGDATFLPDLERLVSEIVRGQSPVGSWGHRFVQDNGRLAGYGMMNAPGLPLATSLVLARKAGVESEGLDRAIERSLLLVRFYDGKGSIPYGDHHPWIQTHDDNGKNGAAAVLFNLAGEAGPTEYFSRMSVASHGAERDTGHTGNYFNMLWAMPGVALSGPHASGSWMQEFSWYYDLARHFDGTFQHQGPPAARPDKYKGWDTSGPNLLAYGQALRKIYLCGRQASLAPQIQPATAQALIEDGRGWAPRDKHAPYEERTDAELLAGLRSWSPVVRDRSAMTLAERGGEFMPQLTEWLDSDDLYARLGACQAIAALGKRASSAVPALRQALKAEDLWLRVKAAEALAAIGEEAKGAVPDLLAMLAEGDDKEDPRGMQQRYLCFTLFQSRGGMLKGSLEGVDREALYRAVRAGLENEDGRARGALGSVYRNLSYDEIEPLLPAIHRAVVEPAPSGIMFADGIRLSGLEVMAKHRIAEGMPLCLEVIEPDRWGKGGRITKCLKALQLYGGAARGQLPALEALLVELSAHREAKNLQKEIELLRETIRLITTDRDPPALRSLTSLHYSEFPLIMRLRFLFGLVHGLSLSLLALSATGQDEKSLPREHVIDVPAVGEGLCVHNLFQSNMVLQREKPVAIWGWASPGERVSVSFAGQRKDTTAAEDRSWKVELEPLAATSEPQSLIVSGKDAALTLDNVLVGDVWVLGGQSNMEFPLSKVQNGHLEIVSANYPSIRILTVPAQNGPEAKAGFPRLHEWSDWSKRHFRKGDWDVCSPDVVRELSAIGYVFARRLHMAAQIPIGVVDVSRGGTTVETWTPRSVLDGIDTPEMEGLFAQWQEKLDAWDGQADLHRRMEQHRAFMAKMKEEGRKIPADRKFPSVLRPGPKMDQNRPGNCYASMIAPIAGFSVKGAIFHQGFNNALGRGADGAAMYYQMFGPMITSWREAFGDPEMPFGIISLCTAGEPQTREDYLEKMVDEGVFLREAQYQTFLDFLEAGDENIGFASSYDKRRSWYHPQLKLPVGERISRWALATEYGFDSDIRWKPPMIEEMRVEEGRLLLRLSTAVRTSDDGPFVGFAIAGEDRRYQPAEASYLVTGHDERNRPQTDRRVLVLTSPHVPQPVHFRYAWGRNPMGNVQTSDHDDLPLATQRSDGWSIEAMPLDYLGEGLVSDQDDPRRVKGMASRDLRLADLERRLNEARRFIEEHEEPYEKERSAVEAERERMRSKQVAEGR